MEHSAESAADRGELATLTLYVSVIGGGQPTPVEISHAEHVGRLLAERGAIVVCGGLGGIMEAAARGAKRAGGTTVGILPGHDRSAANSYLDVVITTGIGHARNLAVVSSGDAVIAVGGEYGTLSEIGLAAKIGRPVVVLGGWRLDRDGEKTAITYASSPAEAVELALQAQRNGPGKDRPGPGTCRHD
jgi:uncharacterized protein (TIGR00725 family)